MDVIRSVQWMNPRAKPQEAYVPTQIEHIANIISHGFMVVPAVVLSHSLTTKALCSQQKQAAQVFGVALISLFLISTCFHIVFYSGRCCLLKDGLHRADRAMIYIYIAACYTPWLWLRDAAWMEFFSSLVWVLAGGGILYQQLYHEKYKWLETVFYLLMGFLPALVIFQMKDHSGVAELAYGGAIYIVGVVFFKMDGRIPMAHAIWHLHVVVASCVHYNAISYYLYNNERPVQHTPSIDTPNVEL